MAPALSYTPRADLTRLEVAALGLATGVFIFFTILLHELGHVYQSMREGMQVHGVTLWALGGVTYSSGGTLSPGLEFRVAVAGPVVTAVLGVVLSGLAQMGLLATGPGFVGHLPEVVARAGTLQIFLLVFNLIPAYPLDGGRMFMATVWKLRGNLTSARATASVVGKGFGGLLIGIGGIGLLAPRLLEVLPPSFRVDSIAGLVIGLMIYSANRSLIAPVAVADHPEVDAGPPGVTVADFMISDFVVTDPKMTITSLLAALGRLQIRPIALVLDDGQPVGMISRQDAERVPEAERDGKKVADVMVSKSEIQTIKANDSIQVAKDALKDGPETAVVLNNDVVVGLVSLSDLARGMVIEGD
ncbi:MAG: site-2 protease family protein [Actinomycetota bacterium]